MVNNHYRWDFIGLSTDDKPTSETSEKVVNGSTFYCSDTSKLYVYCDGTWYERKPLGGGGGGGGSYTAGYGIDIDNDEISVDSDVIATKQDLSSKQNTLTAGTNVTISNDTISATDTTYSDFTGTDGTAAGSAGLVPAPATTDAGKFLSASGLWEAVQGGGGGGIKILTTADYNYPVSNPTRIALWRLPEGIYTLQSSISVCASDNVVADYRMDRGDITIVTNDPVSSNKAVYITHCTGNKGLIYKTSNGSTSQVWNPPADVVNNLSSTSTNSALTAKQGKILNDKIGDLSTLATTVKTSAVAAINELAQGGGGQITPLSDSSAPTTATVGTLGKIFIDTTNADAYMCVAVDDVTPSYTWKKITA